MSYLDIDPRKPTEELLADIRSAAQQPGHPGLALLPFANLLVKVSGNAEETIKDLKQHISDLNEKNGRLQNWVVVLAIASLLATVIQTAVSLGYVTPANSTLPAVQKSPAIPAGADAKKTRG